MQIHVVIGTSGEYSDRDEWVMRAYTDKQEAEQFTLEASAHVRAVTQRLEDADLDVWDIFTHEDAQSWEFWKYDNYFNLENLYKFEKTTYFVVETELVGYKEKE